MFGGLAAVVQPIGTGADGQVTKADVVDRSTVGSARKRKRGSSAIQVGYEGGERSRRLPKSEILAGAVGGTNARRRGARSRRSSPSAFSTTMGTRHRGTLTSQG